MNISIICFSMTGLETGERLQRALEKEGESVTLAKKEPVPSGSDLCFHLPVGRGTVPDRKRGRDLCWRLRDRSAQYRTLHCRKKDGSGCAGDR